MANKRVESGGFAPAVFARAVLSCGHPVSGASVAGLDAGAQDHRAVCLACQDTPAGRLARSLTVPLPSKRQAEQ
jgi:hypothetical protein